MIAMIEKCLEVADDLNAISIAFPAIGTGILEYPSDVVAKCFLLAFTEFAKGNTDGSLKRIKLVVYTEDSSTKEVRLKCIYSHNRMVL